MRASTQLRPKLVEPHHGEVPEDLIEVGRDRHRRVVREPFPLFGRAGLSDDALRFED